MKRIIIFFSASGNTKKIAETVQKVLKCDKIELKLKKEIPINGFLKIFWFFKQVLLKAKPQLLPLEKDFKDYDLIIIGTPVWANSISSPIRSFLKSYKISEKKIALFCCSASGSGRGKPIEILLQSLRGNKVVSKASFTEPKKDNSEQTIKKAKGWAKEILSKTG